MHGVLLLRGEWEQGVDYPSQVICDKVLGAVRGAVCSTKDSQVPTEPLSGNVCSS